MSSIVICRYDYLNISNENKQTFRLYCGQKTGQIVSITGDDAVITFHSDEGLQKRGFLLFFTAIPIGKYNISLDTSN